MSVRVEETRQMFLDAGRKLIDERGLDASLPRFSVTDLLQRVPKQLTRGAFHHIWQRREDFEMDLIRRLLREWGEHDSGPIAKVVASLDIEEGADLDELIDGLAAGIVGIDDRDQIVEFLSVMACTFSALNDGVIDEMYAELEAPYTELIELLVGMGGMRLRPGVTASTALMVISSFIDAYTIRFASMSVDVSVERLEAFRSASRIAFAGGIRSLLEPAE